MNRSTGARRFKRYGIALLLLTTLPVFHGLAATAASQNCGVNTVSGSSADSSSVSGALAASDTDQLSSSAEQEGTQAADSASPDGAAQVLLSLLNSESTAESTPTLTDLVLANSNSQSSTGLSQNTSSVAAAPSANVTAESLLTGSTNSEGSDAEGGDCSFGFDLESGDSGESEITARGGDSGDAIGGDARGGDSTAVGISGNVVVGGNGGPGGSAGGSGAYAGAVIGDNSKGGGGDGGDGGYAVCIGGPTTNGGKSCSSGDVIVISGNGGNATGGNARSGDGGEVGIQDTGTGSTGDNDAG